jgi:hypothetical protein
MEEVSRNRRSAIEIRVRDPSSISLLRAELILSVGLYVWEHSYILLKGSCTGHTNGLVRGSDHVLRNQLSLVKDQNACN